MKTNNIINDWFIKWEEGDYNNIPISDNFQHKSPFGTIHGKEYYLKIVSENEDKFLGQTFEIIDSIYEKEKACVQYIARQGNDFKLEVTEWFYIEDNLIRKVCSYYHIGEINKEREIENY